MDIHAALEIGTTRTVLAIGEAQNDGRLHVIRHEEIPSTGIRKSQIIDIEQATQSIRSVLRALEKKRENGVRVDLVNVVLAVNGQHVTATHAEGQAIVSGSSVGNNEITEAIRRSREIQIPPDRELLDIVDQDYVLDNRGGIASPKGMAGRNLKINTLQIHALANRITDAKTAAAGAHLEIREPVFTATCAAEAVLQEHERKNGALVLDLGGGSTGYAVYSDGFLVAAGVIGVGGDHITNDIAHAFQTTNVQAEQLKIEESSAVLGRYTNENARVRLAGSATIADRTISRRALDTVVNARLKELFAVLRETLEDADLLHRLHAGIILTGGGADMRDIDALASQTLGMSVRWGRPINVDGLENEQSPWAYASIAGALLYSYRNLEESSFLDTLFGKFFKK